MLIQDNILDIHFSNLNNYNIKQNTWYLTVGKFHWIYFSFLVFTAFWYITIWSCGILLKASGDVRKEKNFKNLFGGKKQLYKHVFVLLMGFCGCCFFSKADVASFS